MGSIADTYKKKEVMSHEQWLASLRLDMEGRLGLNSKGHMT